MTLAVVLLLAVCAVNSSVTCAAVLHDMRRARSYRHDMSKLWAGVVLLNRGNPVLARRNHEKTRNGQGGNEDLAHDLIIAARTDR